MDKLPCLSFRTQSTHHLCKGDLSLGIDIVRKLGRQIIANSAEVTPKYSLVGESSQNLGLVQV